MGWSTMMDDGFDPPIREPAVPHCAMGYEPAGSRLHEFGGRATVQCIYLNSPAPFIGFN